MKNDIDYTQISIAIPTNGRPASLRNCISSVVSNIHKDCPIIVLDSTPSDTDRIVLQDYERVYEDFPSVNLLKYSVNVPPGKARKLLSENVKTKFALFLDDDLEIGEGAFLKMFSTLTEKNFDIISGLWVEESTNRDIGFIYVDATLNNNKTIVKCAVSSRTIPSDTVVQLHDVQASLLVKMSIFDHVKFDERYDFFFELYDFFFQCHLKTLKVGVHTGVIFYHRPKPYLSKSSRYYQKREIDRDRFQQKWGMRPEFARHP